MKGLLIVLLLVGAGSQIKFWPPAFFLCEDSLSYLDANQDATYGTYRLPQMLL